MYSCICVHMPVSMYLCMHAEKDCSDECKLYLLFFYKYNPIWLLFSRCRLGSVTRIVLPILFTVCWLGNWGLTP